MPRAYEALQDYCTAAADESVDTLLRPLRVRVAVPMPRTQEVLASEAPGGFAYRASQPRRQLIITALAGAYRSQPSAAIGNKSSLEKTWCSG